MIRQVHPSNDADDSRPGEAMGAGPDPEGFSPAPSAAETWQQLFAPVRKEFAKLKAYAGYYLSVQADRVGLQVRKGVIYAVLAIAAVMVGTAAVITATVVLIQGIVGGLTVLLDGRAWAAQLVTGAAILVLTIAAAYAGVRYVTGASFARTMKKYEQRRKTQRAEFGRDVHDESGRRPIL